MAQPNEIVEELISSDGVPVAAEPKVVNPLPEPKVGEQPNKVEEKSEEKSEEKPEEVVDFTSFENIKGVDKIPEVKPKLEVKPEVEIPQERDYSDIDPELAPLFKQMSNEAFRRLKPVLKEHKEALEKLKAKDVEVEEVRKNANKLPDNYYEHPHGFVLTPEYSETSSAVSLCKTIADHWAGQLAKVREGAAEVEMLDINPKTGELYIAEKKKADAGIESELITNLNFANQQLFVKQAELQSIAKTHQSKHSEAISWLNQHEKAVFPAFDDPKNEGLSKTLTEVINRFPPSFRSNPLSRLVAKSLITNNLLFKRVTELSNNKPVQQVAKITKDKQQAGPNSAEAVGVSAGKSEEVSFDDFERLKSV